MRLFAFAALLALPLLGLGAQRASADYYCCGKSKDEGRVAWAYVVKDSAIFGCDAYHCETKIKVNEGTKVKVYCNNGWCRIKNFPFSHMWVLENCLKFAYHQEDGEEGGDNENGGEEGGDEGEGGQGYKRHYRKY